jgi:hypothetical protein
VRLISFAFLMSLRKDMSGRCAKTAYYVLFSSSLKRTNLKPKGIAARSAGGCDDAPDNDADHHLLEGTEKGSQLAVSPCRIARRLSNAARFVTWSVEWQ